MLFEDQVLFDPKKDQLGRKSLVGIMTKSILSKVAHEHGPVTFGVLGAWGEGKTTFMRMVQTSLEEAKSDRFETIWYDPWEISDEKRMTVDFFSLLAEHAYDNQSIGIALNNYGRAFLSQGDSRLLAPVLSDSVARLSRCIPFQPKDMANAKVAISKKLKDLDRHLIVFIDDIDRLDENEVHTVFRLIRQIADFDNVIYILGLDPDVVSSILANGIDKDKETGRTYLSKIVQIPIVLPPVNDDNLKKLISDFLGDLIKENDMTVPPKDIEEVSSLAVSLLRTKRDIIRYINQLGFVLPAIHVETEFVDLCISELIKYHSEEGWLEMYRNRDILLGSYSEQEKKDVFDDCVNLISYYFPENKRRIIVQLITNHLFTKEYKGPTVKSINNELYFAQYFVCGVPWDVISQEDILVLKRRIEAVDEGQISKWLNSKARLFSYAEVDRASRTAMSLIKQEGKSTEKAAYTLSRVMSLSDISKGFSFRIGPNPSFSDTTISCVLIPDYLGKFDSSGVCIVNREFESNLLDKIYKNAELNFAMHVFYGVYSPNGVVPLNEQDTFNVLKRRLLKKSKLQPFKYSYLLLSTYMRIWQNLYQQEYNEYLKSVLEDNSFDACKLIIDWLEESGANEQQMSRVVNELSDLFDAVSVILRANIEKSKLKDHKLVHFFQLNSRLYDTEIPQESTGNGEGGGILK